jgi:glycosyltransferase involved in cell wall biosynthesis
MKVLHLITSDVGGGAARAAYRLHKGMQAGDISSKMLVQEKGSEDETVLTFPTKLGRRIAQFRSPISRLPLELYRQRERAEFSIAWLPDQIAKQIKPLQPHVINLHWIGGGFLQIESIAKFKQPIVWTLHDMWAFTGGCHYNQNCDRYTASCGQCPQLHSQIQWDLSGWEWQRKNKALRQSDLTVVSPSRWLANCARASTLLKDVTVEVIPNGLDLRQYKPIPRHLARDLLNLPQDKHLALFGAMKATSDRRKGFHLLQPVLQRLSQAGWQDKLELVIMGSSQPTNPPEFGLMAHYLGKLTDETSMALVYSAADVFIAPSVQDNLPNTVMEAIACGTPCVAFDIGGMSDMIEHQCNGYLAQPDQVEDFAQGLAWVLEDSERYKKLSFAARNKAEQEFSIELQVKRYRTLYEKIISDKSLSSDHQSPQTVQEVFR